MVVESLKAIAAEEMSPAVKVMFGVAAVLNSKPAGALSTSVIPVPALKSNLFPSLMTIEPRLVQAGADALAALSAEIFSPPVAGVIDAAANAELAESKKNKSSFHVES